MSEQVQSPSASLEVTKLLIPVSAGSLLRSAREAEGSHIVALAVLLKVPVNKIEAIEADRLDMLPDLVFARALASSMCRALKIDSTPVLEKMPVSSTPSMKTDETGINTPFRVPGEASTFILWRHLSKPVVLAVIALLVSALALLIAPFLQKIWHAETITSHSAGATQLPFGALFPSGGVDQVGAVIASPATVLSTSDVSTIGSQVSIDVFSKAASVSTPLDTLSPTINGSGLNTGLLTLKARDASWVQVTDAVGVVQVRKTLFPGNVVGVSGALPLSVVLGRADAVDVQVKGQPFDVTSGTKDNIARFEVR